MESVFNSLRAGKICTCFRKLGLVRTPFSFIGNYNLNFMSGFSLKIENKKYH